METILVVRLTGLSDKLPPSSRFLLSGLVSLHWHFRTTRHVGELTLKPGSQIPLYFTGGSLSYMVKDLGGASVEVWLPVSNTLVLASICPFVSYLQDLFGRRYITLFGSIIIMVGIAIFGTAHSFAQAVAVTCLAGGGAAIGELTALAGYDSFLDKSSPVFANNVD